MLIIAAQNGDANALAALYDAYADRIYRYVYYRVDSRETAEDLTAEVFLCLLEGLSTYETRQRSILAWLYRVAHARLIDHYRLTTRRGTTQNIERLWLVSE